MKTRKCKEETNNLAREDLVTTRMKVSVTTRSILRGQTFLILRREAARGTATPLASSQENWLFSRTRSPMKRGQFQVSHPNLQRSWESLMMHRELHKRQGSILEGSILTSLETVAVEQRFQTRVELLDINKPMQLLEKFEENIEVVVEGEMMMELLLPVRSQHWSCVQNQIL
jgi:hypothetical protein